MSKPYWIDETQRPGDWIEKPFRPDEPPYQPGETRDAATANIERRVISGASLRAAVEDGQRILSGYAATYGTLSRNMGKAGNKPWFEKISPGAFEKSLRSDIRFTVNHDISQVMGRTRAGTLSIGSDKTGLSFRCLLPDTEAGRSLHTSVMRGDLSDMSFAFTDPEATWSEEDYDDEDDDTRSLKKGSRVAVRTLHSCAVQDVSCVTFPAYKGTSVQARSLPIVLATPPEVLEYRPWFAEATRRADMVAKIIERDRIAEDDAAIRQRRHALLNGVLS